MTTLLPKAYGNHATICRFLTYAAKLSPKRATDLLSALSEKDLRDVTYDVLADNFLHTRMTGDTVLYARYVLNPRVANEELYPYKKYFDNALSIAQKDKFRADPAALLQYINDNITISDRRNPRHLRISPVSAWRHKGDIDAASRDILFVAMARSCGIPARIDPVTQNLEYSTDNRTWTAATTATQKDNPAAKIDLRLRYINKGTCVDDPKYYANFALSRITDGVPEQLAYDDFTPWSKTFKSGTMIDPGYYMLVSGQRLANGGVLARAVFFEAAKPTVPVPLTIRSDNEQVQVIGSFNSENIYHDINSDSDRSLLSTTGRGYYVLGFVSPAHEPTSHALNDLSAVAEEFDRQGVKLMLIFADKSRADRFNKAVFGKLPANTVIGYDVDGNIARDLTENMKANTNDTPVFIIADTFNRVVYLNQGYTIHLGDKIVNILKRL